MFDWIHHFDMAHWIATIGYVGLIAIVFLETGVFFGFFLPGDSLLFIAGVLASKGVFNIGILVTTLTITAILGYAVGYWFGNKLGHWLLARNDSIWFRKRYLEQARDFYKKHGGKALILGRLVPIVRTFAPVVAGMAEMPYGRYMFFNICGAIVWAFGVTMLGYLLGGIFPNAGKFILPIAIAIILISVLPGFIHYIRQRKLA